MAFAACRANIDPASPIAGEVAGGPAVTLRNVRLLVILRQIRTDGVPHIDQ
jgi:hypothetical protein